LPKTFQEIEAKLVILKNKLSNYSDKELVMYIIKRHSSIYKKFWQETVEKIHIETNILISAAKEHEMSFDANLLNQRLVKLENNFFKKLLDLYLQSKK